MYKHIHTGDLPLSPLLSKMILFNQIVRLTYFSEDLARHVITQVGEALEYLHEEKGVAHRYVLAFINVRDYH